MSSPQLTPSRAAEKIAKIPERKNLHRRK